MRVPSLPFLRLCLRLQDFVKRQVEAELRDCTFYPATGAAVAEQLRRQREAQLTRSGVPVRAPRGARSHSPYQQAPDSSGSGSSGSPDASPANRGRKGVGSPSGGGGGGGLRASASPQRRPPPSPPKREVSGREVEQMYSRQLAWLREREERLHIERLRRVAAELQPCTFAPATTTLTAGELPASTSSRRGSIGGGGGGVRVVDRFGSTGGSAAAGAAGAAAPPLEGLKGVDAYFNRIVSGAVMAAWRQCGSSAVAGLFPFLISSSHPPFFSILLGYFSFPRCPTAAPRPADRVRPQPPALHGRQQVDGPHHAAARVQPLPRPRHRHGRCRWCWCCRCARPWGSGARQRQPLRLCGR